MTVRYGYSTCTGPRIVRQQVSLAMTFVQLIEPFSFPKIAFERYPTRRNIGERSRKFPMMKIKCTQVWEWRFCAAVRLLEQEELCR